jgi:WD40 repeat protein
LSALRTLVGHSASVWGVAVTPDGRRAVSASDDRTLKIWDFESGRAVGTLQGHEGSVLSVAVTPDGRRAVSASSDKTLKVWDLEKLWYLEGGRALRTLAGHEGPVLSVAVTPNTPDGERAVSASRDRTLRIWNLESGSALSLRRSTAVMRTLEGHSAPVSDVAVTPAGTRAVSASDDGTLKVWDLESGRAVRSLEGHGASVASVAVTPDGRWAVSASVDKTLKVWQLR